ncbi:pectinesterase family protein [Labilibaculum sp. K2S]|uniref:pectinesterase family protein n=1 Tax=Labilibaculum sp. K2S TaxID=3056386 RepID=UPI0025A39686|nr:pectinesterase family protein [Labilibaculum sp. K2S]MDM8161780.1 pectinesterase family protein [Labilibaculum sp. K2S]
MKYIWIIALLTVFTNCAIAGNKGDIVVAADGTGDYISLTEAIDHLPFYNYQRLVIFVKNGVYNEKIRIEQDYLTIRGENRDSTIIQYAQLREDWQKNRDYIGPAVINIHADDIILDNLTIRNTQPKLGPHAFTIYGTGTRTIITNCNVTSNGGDTVSLWNYKEGMYYHDNCYFEGGVDFVCPRGWCYISNSSFKELMNTAAVWHAATTNENQKMVLSHCEFMGVDSFYLARHHYEAQFYFLNCRFPAEMRDKSILHVFYPDKPEKNRPYLYGDRYNFYNCDRKAGNYSWFANNMDSSSVAKITPEWTFDQKWNPEDTSSIKVVKVEYENESLFLWFDEIVMPVGDLKIRTKSGKIFSYFNGVGRERFEFKGESNLTKEDLQQKFEVLSGTIQSIKATVKPKTYK